MVGKILFYIFGGASLLLVLFMVFIHIVMLVRGIKNIRMCRYCLRKTEAFSEDERARMNRIITANKADIRICLMVISGLKSAFMIGYLIGHFIL